MGEKRERGFAAMDPQEQREIASRGGRAAHESGHAHEFNSQEAAAAGRKGGEEVSKDRGHMAEIGRKGGLASHHRHSANHNENSPAKRQKEPGQPVAVDPVADVGPDTVTPARSELSPSRGHRYEEDDEDIVEDRNDLHA